MTAGYGPHDVERLVHEDSKRAALPQTEGFGDRSDFARDRARVLHSASFRRLAGKTQVVAPDEDDVPRTRLTHSLEVAQIARDIGGRLGADPDLVDLAGLAHDLGHPPFGHNGEAALDAVGAAAGGFEANAQNLRLLTDLEPKVIDATGRAAGLNLTRASLDAVVKYPWARPAEGGKFGVYESEAAVFGWVREGVPGPRARCLEAQVMDWADDVAYSVHDIEDGVSGGRIDLRRLADPAEQTAVAEAATGYSTESPTDLYEVLTGLLALPAVVDGVAGALAGWHSAAALKQLTSELTGRFVVGAVAETLRAAGGAPLQRYDAEVRIPRVLRAEVALLKAVALHYVMAEPGRRAIQDRERQLLTELVMVTAERGPDVLDVDFARRYRAASDDASRLRVVLDQVSLLTDAQAVSRHRRLCTGS